MDDFLKFISVASLHEHVVEELKRWVEKANRLTFLLQAKLERERHHL